MCKCGVVYSIYRCRVIIYQVKQNTVVASASDGIRLNTLPQFSKCNLSFPDTGTHDVPFSFWLHFHLLEELSKYLV